MPEPANPAQIAHLRVDRHELWRPRSRRRNINSVSLLSEYNHTLNTPPVDLPCNFADFRKLDAILSSSMASVLVKISNAEPSRRRYWHYRW